jgi:uncharacterized protein
MSVWAASFLAAAVLFASTMQVTAGFGFALLAVPLMSLAIDTHDAVVVSTFLGLLTSSLQAYRERREIDRELARRLCLAALVGIPFGLLLFRQVDERVLKAILGIGVLVAAGLLVRRIDLTYRGPGLEWGAGILSGALSSSLSTNGPPLVFALQGRRLPIAVFRGTISVVFSVSGLLTVAAFVVSGEITRSSLVDSIIALPALAIGAALGFRARRFFSEEVARVTVVSLLAVAGLSAFVSALVS